jgi:hypothetical protein
MSSMRCSALSDGEFVEGLRARRLERVEQAEARGGNQAVMSSCLLLSSQS